MQSERVVIAIISAVIAATIVVAAIVATTIVVTAIVVAAVGPSRVFSLGTSSQM
jgi:hypothetical protein